MINVLMFFIFSRGNKTMTKKEKRTMAEYSDYIQDIVKTKKVRLYFVPQQIQKLKPQ